MPSSPSSPNPFAPSRAARGGRTRVALRRRAKRRGLEAGDKARRRAAAVRRRARRRRCAPASPAPPASGAARRRGRGAAPEARLGRGDALGKAAGWPRLGRAAAPARRGGARRCTGSARSSESSEQHKAPRANDAPRATRARQRSARREGALPLAQRSSPEARLILGRRPSTAASPGRSAKGNQSLHEVRRRAHEGARRQASPRLVEQYRAAQPLGRPWPVGPHGATGSRSL